MKRNHLFWAVAAALASAAAGCGDNSRQCGTGTVDMNGVCTGQMCGDGTVLDTASGQCVIDPNSCQDGTVLIDGACVDPGHVKADLEEGAEPNALGAFGEVSANPAGDFTIPNGKAFVIHGTIAPFQDETGGFDDMGNPAGDGQPDTDVDTYTFTVGGPTLVEITSDGLHGLGAGFGSFALITNPNDPMGNWVRIGLNPLGDTSKRAVFIPTAGDYALVIADSRNLMPNAPAGLAPGAEEGKPAFEYYVTIKTQPITTTPLAVTNQQGLDSGTLDPGAVKLFEVPMGLGQGNATLTMNADQAAEALVVTNTRGSTLTVKGVGVGEQGPANDFICSFFGALCPAQVFTIGYKTGDTTLLAVDTVFNYAQAPIDYSLVVDAFDAGALPTDGTTVSQPASDTAFSTFFYDVANDGEITGMDLSFDRPMQGVIVDENFFIFASFSFQGGFNGEFQDYKGLLRHFAKGRYYFLTFDSNGGTADVVATSSYAPVTAGTVTKGTLLAAQTNNAFESNPYNYAPDIATDAWQEFNAKGVNSGTIKLVLLNPAELDFSRPGFGFGRLDDVTCTPSCGVDVNPFSTSIHAQNGSTPIGRILIDDNVATYLVIANTTTVAGNTTFDLDFKRRDHTDLGTKAGGMSANAAAVALNATTPIQRFLIRTDANNILDGSVTPGAGLNTAVQLVNADESALGALINNGGAATADTFQTFQGANGWTALTVTRATGNGTFDLDINVIAAVNYQAAATATAFDDACTGGTVVALPDPDEGVSAAIATPAGFDFFGLPAPQIVISSNGFVSVDTALTNAAFGNRDIPTTGTPDGFIAPFWDDLDLSNPAGGVCVKTMGTKLIIQWTGGLFNGDPATQKVAFQAILDGADDSIEFVYDGAANHTLDGTTATSGIENQVGSGGKKITFNEPITAGSSIKLSPM